MSGDKALSARTSSQMKSLRNK
ncbi:hypothetical protein SGPA1_10529 [Streptomyces misionensis JCM 4497]